MYAKQFCHLLAYCLIAMLVIFYPLHTYGQNADTSSVISTDRVMNSFMEKLDMQDSSRQVLLPAPAYLTNKQQQDYTQFSIMHLKRTFNWQYYSSLTIFIVVMSIVLMGLLLSYKQFKLQEWQVKNTTGQDKPTDNTESSRSRFELGKDGIKIDSAVIGLIILTISLIFLYLYLRYVYPIQVLSLS